MYIYNKYAYNVNTLYSVYLEKSNMHDIHWNTLLKIVYIHKIKSGFVGNSSGAEKRNKLI